MMALMLRNAIYLFGICCSRCLFDGVRELLFGELRAGYPQNRSLPLAQYPFANSVWISSTCRNNIVRENPRPRRSPLYNAPHQGMENV